MTKYPLTLFGWHYYELDYNKIEDAGCQLLSGTKWKYLEVLYLGSNKIKAEGSKYLSSARWTNLAHLDLGIFYMNRFQQHWRSRLQVSFESWLGSSQTSQPLWYWNYVAGNEIGQKGCKYLSKANWKKLEVLNLRPQFLT